MASNHLVRPFAGLRPAAGRANEIAAPPYDVVNAEEARAAAKEKPNSFFHISRAEIDLPENVDPYSDRVYETAGKNLQRFKQQGLLVRDTSPCFYVYRITKGEKVQTGVAALASVDAYLENRIRKHELTRPSKEDDRVRQINAVNSITGPVLCVHRSEPDLSSVLDRVAASPSAAIAQNVDGACHELWVISDVGVIKQIEGLLNQMDAIYIADGHHRSAASARVAMDRRKRNSLHHGRENYNGFLVVSFPQDEVRILDYNRVILDLNGLSPAEFMGILDKHFYIDNRIDPVRPSERLTFGLYLAGRWSLIRPRNQQLTQDPIKRLDVSVLSNMVFEPMLNVRDQRTDLRIDFVGGSRGPEEIARRVDSGEMAAGFTLFPTSLEDLMNVADAGMIMPPKSTWFDPKLADGMISVPLD
ncbi:MAG: DUF1015 family protein [Pseudomonadota bacterium]|nr:DUF1015 family protein [Pseudomonadota bacterium]